MECQWSKKKIRINLNEAVIQHAGSEIKTSATVSDSSVLIWTTHDKNKVSDLWCGKQISEMVQNAHLFPVVNKMDEDNWEKKSVVICPELFCFVTEPKKPLGRLHPICLATYWGSVLSTQESWNRLLLGPMTLQKAEYASMQDLYRQLRGNSTT